MISVVRNSHGEHHDRDSHLANSRNVVVDILDLDKRSDPRFFKNPGRLLAKNTSASLSS
jgi:hypothetical protein